MTERTTNKSSRPWLILLVASLTCLVAIAGYYVGRKAGRSAANDTSVGTSPRADRKIERYGLRELNPLGAYLPPLDEDRLLVAPPDGWVKEPQKEEYVARFRWSKRNPLPQITVTVRPAEFTQPADLDEDSLAEFEELMVKSMNVETRNTIVKSPMLLMLENVPCVRYVVSKTYELNERRIPGESEVIVTLSGGRIYAVTLDANKGKPAVYQRDLLAVVAGMKFLKPKPPADGEDPPAGQDPETAVPNDGEIDQPSHDK